MTTLQAPQPDLSRLQDVVASVMQQASNRGATQAEAAVSIERGLSVTARIGDVETLEHHKDQGIGITVYYGQHKGSASSSDLGQEAVNETLDAACNIAKFTSEDDCAGLADAELMASSIPELYLDHPWSLPPADAIELAIECENAARKLDARITNSEGATVSSVRGTSVYGNTHGFLYGYRGTRHSLSCIVVAQESQRMQRDYWYTVARDCSDLQSAETVGKQAAERSLQRLGARKIDTCQAPIMFAAELAGGLLSHFISAVNGHALYRKASFLLGCLDKQIFPDFVHIYEQPHLEGALGSAPYDAEGVATVQRDIVSEGILRSYVLNSYAARKLGMVTTGNAGGVHNLCIDSTGKDRSALLHEMQRGLLVTELIGHGVNTVTGDYSRGAVGFWVERGAIQFPVEEITIAGNLKDMFLGIVDVGSDVDLRGNIRSGSILIDNMTIAGR